MTKVEESGYDVNGLVGGVDIKGKFRMMLDTSGQPIKGTEIDSMQKAYVDNGAWDKTKAQMIVGDFNEAVYSIRQDMTYKVLTEAVIDYKNFAEAIEMASKPDTYKIILKFGE